MPLNAALVSIITPFLNAGSFIDETVQSVLNQTYRSWELLLVDDGSTDSSTAKARAYAAANPDQIAYLEHSNHENRGSSASRNLALCHAQGKYITLLDADDVWVPNKLEDQVQLMEGMSDIDLLYGHTIWWYSWTGREEDAHRDGLRALGLQTGRIYLPGSLIEPYFFSSAVATPCTCSLIIRRSLIDRVGGPETSFRRTFGDQAWYLKLFLAGSTYVSGEIWDRYRQHNGSMCHVDSKPLVRWKAKLDFLNWAETYFAAEAVGEPLSSGLRRAVWTHQRMRLLYFMPPSLRWRVRSGLELISSRFVH